MRNFQKCFIMKTYLMFYLSISNGARFLCSCVSRKRNFTQFDNDQRKRTIETTLQLLCEFITTGLWSLLVQGESDDS